MSIGEIVMFLSFSLIFLPVIEDLTWLFESIFWNITSIIEYFTILYTPIEVQNVENAIQIKDVEGDELSSHEVRSSDLPLKKHSLKMHKFST